jgi:hypothetical protein
VWPLSMSKHLQFDADTSRTDLLIRALGYRQKDAGTGTRTGKCNNAGTVHVPGSWSNIIDLLGQGVRVEN